MKAVVIIIMCLCLAGCMAGKIIIPAIPEFQRIAIYNIEGGVCIDNDNFQLLTDNITRLKKHCDKLTELLEDQNKKGF